MAGILLVDDSSFFRFVSAQYLVKLGHKIVGEADDKQSALDKYKELSPDIVILDLVLKNNGNGIDVLREMMAIDPRANIIICSSSAFKSVIVQAVEIGAKGYVIKPMEGDILKETIDQILLQNESEVTK